MTVQPDAIAMNANRKSRFTSNRFWGLSLFALAATAVLRHYAAWVVVSGVSMAPTYHEGDWILVARNTYRQTAPSRGDLVVARVGDELYLKRVVGLPGETVAVQEGRVFINDRPMATGEPDQTGLLTLGRGRLAADRYALLGDNRMLPCSATQHAIVSRAQIVGKVMGRILPFEPFRGERRSPMNTDGSQTVEPLRSTAL